MKKNVLDQNSIDFESTNRLLKVIIALLLRQRVEDGASLRSQIKTLDGLGVRPSEIAQILGRTSTHISKELVGIRKSKKGE